MHHIKEKREPEYTAELETHLILRLPVEPAKALREVLKSGDNLKNRLKIKVENDMRHGEVRFDHWLMHSKIVDLPTIIESLKTIDNKSFYKTADLCQMMICKEEPDLTTTEDEAPIKNKKKDPYKVDKKFLWPHGVTPPTKNVRKRRFRKTLRKKFVEAPEIEKEVKRLLRADNEAVSVTWEIIQDEEDNHPKPEQSKPVNIKPQKKQKAERNLKPELATRTVKSKSSEVVDIFGEAVSDSDLDEDNVNVQLEDSQLSAYEQLTEAISMHGLNESSSIGETFSSDFTSHSLQSRKAPVSHTITSAARVPTKISGQSSDDDLDYQANDMPKDDMTLRIEQLKTELDELKQRRQRTQHEISGMENMALQQRFQEILHTLNQDIMFKEMEYQGMLTLQNSEDI